MADNPLSLWATAVASTDQYKNSTPEEQAQDKRDFFTQYIAPNSSDLDNSYVTFMLATKPAQELYNNNHFLNLDEAARKKVLADNIQASGGTITPVPDSAPRVTGGQEFSLPLIGKIPLSKPPMMGGGADIQQPESPEVTAAYNKFQNSPEEMNRKGRLLLQDATAFPQKAIQTVASVIPGQDAQTVAETFNNSALEREKLQHQEPKMAGLETAADMAYAGPVIRGTAGALEAGSEMAGGGRIGSWLSRQVGTGVASAPVSITAAAPGEDIKEHTRKQAEMSAIVGAGANTIGEAAFSPTARNFVSRIGSWFNREKDVGARLAGDVRKANPNMTPEQVQQELQQAQTNVQASPPGQTTFTGAQSGNEQFRDMQANVPGTNYTGEIYKQFENPSAPLTAPIEAQASTKELPNASEYIATKIQPQVKAEFKVAQKNAVDSLTQAKTDFGNKIFADARDSGVLKEPLGQSKNQFTNELGDMIKANPDLQKSGLFTIKNGKVTSSVGSISRALKGTNGPAKLTVDDATRMLREMSGDLDSNNAEVIKPIMSFVENKLSGSQSEGVAKLRQTYAEFNKTIDETTDLTKQQFNAAASFEQRFAKQPVMKALHSGGQSGSAVGKAIRGELPDTEIPAIRKDKILHQTTKAAVAADMMDTLAPQNLGGKSTSLDLGKFADTYGSETAANNVRKLFDGDKEFLDNFEQLRQNAIQANKVAGSVRVAPAADAGENLKNIAAGAIAQTTGARGQLATAAAGPLAILQKRSAQLLRDSITDKTKAGAILDAAIKAQKGRIRYTDLYDKYVAPGVGLAATQSGKAITEPNEPDSFEPQDLTKGSKSGTITKVDPLAYRGTMTGAATRLNELTPKSDDVDLKKTARNVAAAGAMALATTTPAAKSSIPDLTPKQAKYAAAVTGVESNFGKNKGKGSPTGPQGTGQFYSPAKHEVEARLGRKIDLNNDKDSLLAIATYADINKERLTKMGVKPTDADLYAAHMLGAGTFKKLHDAAKEEVASGTKVSAGKIVPSDAYRSKGNRSVFFDDKGKQYTPAQVLKVLRNKYKDKTKDADAYLVSIK